jgi:predicted PurR-regulated permease PerM
MVNPRENWLRIATSAALLSAAVLLVWRVRAVIAVVLLAVVCSYVLRPVVQAISDFGPHVGGRRRGVSRGVAAAAVFTLLLALLWLTFRLTAPSLGRQIGELQAGWPRLLDAVVVLASDAEQYYSERLPPSLRPAVDSWVEDAADALTATAGKGVGATVHGVGFVIEMLLVPILAFYFLADGPSIRRQALFFVPQRYLARTERVLDRSDDIFQRYIKGQVILCIIAFVVVTLGLWLLKVDFYLLLGIFAGLTRAVPIIGPVVGGVPIMIVVLVTKSTSLALWVLAAFSLMHFLESKFLMPAILGHHLDLHPVLIIVALLVGAQMGGLLGIFLAAPVLAAVKTLVRQRRENSASAAA